MDTLLKGIVGLALLLYIAAISYLGVMSLHAQWQPKPPDDFNEVIPLFITTTSGALATFVGMVLGFHQANRATGRSTVVTHLNRFQTIAAWIYVASLVLAVAFWALDGFRGTMAEAVQNLAKSLLGLFAGALAVALKTRGTV